MVEKRLKRPRDPVQLGKVVGDSLTGQVESHTPTTEEKDAGASELARQGGPKGGKAQADGLTPRERQEIARKAAFRDFRSPNYLRHNTRRQEHLTSLGLNLHGRSVLELGAGIGDHTTFFLDRGCTVTSVEPRLENCQLYAALMRRRRAEGYDAATRCRIIRADALSFESLVSESFDVVYCYGLLYHTDDPEAVLAAMARKCREYLLLETCVSFGSHEAINPKRENARLASQSVSGKGCRCTRPWLFKQLSALFAHVYVPRTQPAHEEFPLDWNAPPAATRVSRAVFIASRHKLDNPSLLDYLPDRQTAC